jgi:hypothetical protein
VKAVTIDLRNEVRRDGHCQFCNLPRTLFPVKLDNDSWTAMCRGCAEADGAKVMP